MIKKDITKLTMGMKATINKINNIIESVSWYFKRYLIILIHPDKGIMYSIINKNISILYRFKTTVPFYSTKVKLSFSICDITTKTV